MGRDKHLQIPDNTLDLTLEMQGDVLLEETEPMHDFAILRPQCLLHCESPSSDFEMGKQQEQGELEVTPERVLAPATVDGAVLCRHDDLE
jgi:hypothetical protein